MNTLGKILLALAAGMLVYNLFVVGPTTKRRCENIPSFPVCSGAISKRGLLCCEWAFSELSASSSSRAPTGATANPSEPSHASRHSNLANDSITESQMIHELED